jgi:uncharacterized beta-barrel protein YwiB (DUF1934 family)
MQNSKINLTMHIIQGNERSKTSYEADANFLEKDGKFFLFFDEENEDSNRTKCRFEISDDTLRMRRNGPIVMEQRHIQGQKTEGYIKTPFGQADTKIRTFQFSFVKRANGHYHLDLGYDLYTGAQKTGTYLLEIIIIK